ncbi:hypothetical protein N7486_008716 [Penicillium sp. IBT 16267x]|nr:hypothetical protein N7486_008716 [Penicillium sp. IBT 16267x]
MGIEWAQENIAAFGGNSDRIVLWGQSSGAGIANLMNFAYPDDPIAITSLDQVNCSSTNYTVELECMQGVDYETIEAGILEYEEAGNNPLKFVPFVDDISNFKNYTLRYELDALSGRPAIFGTNLREGYEPVPWPSDPKTTAPNATAIGTTFGYQYRGNFSNISPYFWFGAFHGSEVPLLFGTYGDSRGPPTAFENELVTQCRIFGSFARDGAEGVEALGWKNSADGDGVNILAVMKTQKTSMMTPAKEIDTPCTNG